MGTPDLIGSLLDLGGKVLDRVIPDPAARAEANLKLLTLAQTGELAHLASETEITKAAADIIKTEAASENFITSSWRPILMLVFGALIVARWLGWSAPNLSQDEVLKLWDIVQLGLGGYVIGRSVEKVVPSITGAVTSAVAAAKK
jgi:hypothetical protein